MDALQKSLWVFAKPAFVATAAAQEKEQVQAARIERGELSVEFRDNSHDSAK